MKSRSIYLTLALLIGSLVTPIGAIAASKEKSADAAVATEDAETKKSTTVLVLEASPNEIHAAALEALAAIGCKVKKDSPDHIEAKRSNKVGLAVGSGGEKLFVWIKDLGDGKSELKVTTKKTIVGIVGQKLWNEEVANQIRDAVE